MFKLTVHEDIFVINAKGWINNFSRSENELYYCLYSTLLESGCRQILGFKSIKENGIPKRYSIAVPFGDAVFIYVFIETGINHSIISSLMC